jgi:hypothetical protein
MAGNITFNPSVTTNASGSFNVSADGLIQGTAFDDPSTRFRLRGGILAADETLPMWGGVGIYELVAGAVGAALPQHALGGTVGRANSLAAQAAKQLLGFSVFDQAVNAINTPQSPVPLLASGMGVHYYPLGSLARIAVAADPSLISLDGGVTSALVSWDFTAQRLIPYSATYPTGTITGAVWANTSGGQIDYTVSTDLTSYINAGDDINVVGVVSTGATTDGYNGNYIVVSISATHIVVTAPRTASPGTYASGGTVVSGGGALPVKVLRVKASNCMNVVYDPVTGFATWDRNGAGAVIQI